MIPIYDPQPEYEHLKQEIDEAIQRVLDHGQFILGPEVKAFEEQAADYLGVKHAVGVNSGTDALVIALRALGIGEGDEVITPALSFFATAESISNAGAEPVFVDIDENTFNIDPARIEDAITPKTKAILPVHLFGRPAALAEIMFLADTYDLHVIEDCAQSFGAVYYSSAEKVGDKSKNTAEKGRAINSRKTGAIGDAGTFSFFPTKNLGGIGDGGLLTTDNDEVAHKARMLRVHGAEQKYKNEMLGYNSRLDTIQAAVLMQKLKHIDEMNKRRRKVAERYSEAFRKSDELRLPKIVEGHVFHQYTIKADEQKRDELKNFLSGSGIDTKIYFPIPQNELPVYEKEALVNAHTISKQVLSLPMWPHLTTEVQDQVIGKVCDFFR